MIAVTRINGEPFYINPDLVMTVETTHDTVITLTNGERFVISEPAEVFQNRFIDYKKKISFVPEQTPATQSASTVS